MKSDIQDIYLPQRNVPLLITMEPEQMDETLLCYLYETLEPTARVGVNISTSAHTRQPVLSTCMRIATYVDRHV